MALGVYLDKTVLEQGELLAQHRLLAPSVSPRPTDDRPDRAIRATQDFFAALAEGRHAAAYELLAAPYRSQVSPSAFRALCQASPFLSSSRRFSVSRTRQESAPGIPGRGSMKVIGVLETGAGTLEAAIHFTEEAGAFRVASIVLAGIPVLDAARDSRTPGR